MTFSVFLVIAIVVAVIYAAVLIARQVQRAIDREKRAKMRNSRPNTGPTKSAPDNWISHGFSAYHLWGMAVAALGGLKYIYKEWNTAPVGSLERLGWGLVLMAIGAVGLWIALKIVDNRINGIDKPELEDTQ